MDSNNILVSNINIILYQYFYKKNTNSLKKYPEGMYVKFDLTNDGYQILFYTADINDGNLINLDLVDFIDVRKKLSRIDFELVINMIRKRASLNIYHELDNSISLEFERDNNSGVFYNRIKVDVSFRNLSLMHAFTTRNIIYDFIRRELEQKEEANEVILTRKSPNNDK